jgi:hypothetical protein
VKIKETPPPPAAQPPDPLQAPAGEASSLPGLALLLLRGLALCTRTTHRVFSWDPGPRTTGLIPGP